MAPVVPPVPSAPPDPATTTWGAWEKRINWIVTVIAVLVSLAVAVVEMARTPPVQTAPATLPATAAPSLPDVLPDPDAAPVSLLGQFGEGALAVVGAFLPLGCSAAQQQAVLDWLRTTAAKITPCLAECGLTAGIDSAQQALIVGSVDGQAIGFSAATCAIGCASQVGLSALLTPATPATGTREVVAPTYRILLVKATQ